jgi:EpsD family peptidyl-prolyl cis-trans isomerase
MKFLGGGLLAAAACVALSGCHFGGSSGPPTGQVLAKVGDKEITMRELRAEMPNTSVPDPKARKAAEIAALQRIVARMVLANEARKEGLEKTPDFVVQKDRLTDNLLVQTLQQKTISQMPAPTKDEAMTFMNANPDIFQERKIFSVDQIRMGRPSDPQVLKSLEPLKTLEEIETVLKADNIPFQRGSGALDAVGADPRIIAQVVKLPPGELFVIPGPQGLQVNHVTDVKIVPFTGDAAIKYATDLLTRQRAQETLSRSFQAIIAQSSKSVRFNKDYAPPNTTPSAASPAHAPPPS